MNQRKLFFTALFISVGCILCITLFSFSVSKFKFNSNQLISGVDAREYNSIIAVKQPYDALILGTSMSEGFHTSDLDAAYNCQSLKLTCSGSSLAEIKFLADYARKYKKLNYILLDCNFYTYGEEQDLSKMPLQLYSSDADLYLFKRALSINTFLDSIKFFSKYLRGRIKTVSRDDLYDWNSPDACGEKRLAKELIFKKPYSPVYDDKFINNAEKNVKKHLLPLFKSLPETRFILFFPPYSAMFYRNISHEGFIKLKKAVMDLLIAQKNVELHDFQTEFSITENPDFYKDLTHYSGKINSRMIFQTVKKTHLVTPENQKLLLAKHLTHMKQYDYQGTYEKLKQKYEKELKSKKKSKRKNKNKQ